MNYVERPAFSEGQLLSAADLQLAVDYPRDELETHCSVSHTPGVVDGMAFQIIPPVAPATDAFVAVTAGLAVDNQGRQIQITSALPVLADPLSGQPAGSYPAYVWYTEANVASSMTPLNPCAVSNADRIRESANVGVFLDDAHARAQFPDSVCLGYLGWTGTTFQAYAGTAPDVRQGGGVRAHEIVAPEHAVVAHAEDNKPTTVSVKGTLQAIVSDDGTAPVLGVPGGSLVFSAGAGAPATSAVSLSYAAAPNATSNELVIDLGNNDPTSSVSIESQAGTVLASIDGTGTVTAATGSFSSVKTSSIVVSTTNSTLTLGPTPPSNIAGITASDTLALAFGSASADEVTFTSAGTTVATIDGNALTMSAKSVKVGVIDATSGAAGIGIGTTDDLEVRTGGGDLLLNPGTQTSPPFRLTAGGRWLNQTVSPSVDVTPLTTSGASGSVLQLGALAIAFGTANASLHPLTQSPAAITFGVTFSSPPAFFVSPSGQNLTTIAAVAVNVTTTGATYRITRLAPTKPSDGDATSWSNTTVNVTVSWVALGTLA